MFAIVMGLTGLTLVFEHGAQIWGLPSWLGIASFGLDLVLFTVIALVYAIKWVRHPQAVVAEYNHPIRLSFFPAVSIGLILLGTAAISIQETLALMLWLTGTTLHFVFTLSILSRWMHQTHFEIHHSNPAWFIPLVGNILVPLAGVPLGFEGISWFFFSVGLIFWPILMAVLFNRYFFHSPMPGNLMPTLFILIAPPAVGFISWLSLHDMQGVDDFARLLYSFGLFLTFLLIWQFAHFVRLPFALSWWAYSFPIAAITVATMLMSRLEGGMFWYVLSTILALFLVALILLLVWMTIRAMFRGGICLPE